MSNDQNIFMLNSRNKFFVIFLIKEKKRQGREENKRKRRNKGFMLLKCRKKYQNSEKRKTVLHV